MHDRKSKRRKGILEGGAAPLIGAGISLALFAFVILAVAAEPVRADLSVEETSRFMPLRDVFRHVRFGAAPEAFEQRAIQKPEEETEKPAEAGQPGEGEEVNAPAAPGTQPAAGSQPAPQPAGTPATPPPARQGITSPGRVQPVMSPPSPTRAFLLSAALPGLGELYSGSNRGYLFLGVEAVSWITFASYRSSANNKEGDMFDFADENFSIAAFEQDCVSQPGQPCSGALTALRDFYENDRDEYYEIISKNSIYRTGWGVAPSDSGFIYENCVNQTPGTCPPAEGTEEYRRFVANQAAAQDGDYAAYNGIRDDRNSLSRTARGMTMVALVNHVVSAWDAFMTARGLNKLTKGFKTEVGGQVEMDLKIKGSFGNPGATFVLRRNF